MLLEPRIDLARVMRAKSPDHRLAELSMYFRLSLIRSIRPMTPCSAASSFGVSKSLTSALSIDTITLGQIVSVYRSHVTYPHSKGQGLERRKILVVNIIDNNHKYLQPDPCDGPPLDT